MTIRFSLLIYLATFNILTNIGSHIGPKVVIFNKILYSVLFIVTYNRGIVSLFNYSNVKTFKDIEFLLIK